MNPLTKKVSIATFAIAIMGLLSELFALTNIVFSGLTLKIVFTIKTFFSTIYLSFFSSSLFEYHNFDNGFSTNYFNLLFYVLALTGGILYLVSKQKESRLVRFVFSVVFLINILWFINSLIFPIVYFKYTRSTDFSWIIWLLKLIYTGGLCYISYWLLTALQKTKSLDIDQDELVVTAKTTYVPASNAQRFFHLVIDTIICLLVFSIFARIFGSGLLEKMENLLGERMLIYFFIIFFRLIYYPFFESIFGATPAKFLTETRVTDISGQKIKFPTALLRTFARFIPFEPFSFFGAEGWHDSLTQTQVIRETRKGVNGSRYFLLILLYLILGFGGYYSYDKYKDYRYYCESKTKHIQKIAEIENKLARLTTDDFIKIKKIESYSSDNTYLKVEKIKNDKILFSIITIKDDYRDALPSIEKVYCGHKDALSQTVITKTTLNSAYTKDYKAYHNHKKNGADLLNDGQKYEIECIERLFAPVIRDTRGGSFWDDHLSLEINNYGWAAHMVEIKSIEGSIKWINQLPERIEAAQGSSGNSFSLVGEHAQRGEKYKVKFVLEDSLQRRQSFLVEGMDLKATCKRIDE
jgi:uncharacterized RDD family membrane protein YckC